MQTKQTKIFPHQFPLIIWGGEPNSPLNFAALLSILPYLTERGYSSFGFEYENALNLEAVVDKVKGSIKACEDNKKIIENNMLPLFDSKRQETIKLSVSVISTLKKLLEFLGEIKKQGWSYQGLDMNLGEERNDTFGENLREELNEERMKIMVKHIVGLHQNASKSGSGVITYMSLPNCIGVSELLYQSLGKEASKNILFLYVFAAENPDIGVIQKQKEELAKKYEQQGISFNCELIASDENCLRNIKKAIEANTKVEGKIDRVVGQRKMLEIFIVCLMFLAYIVKKLMSQKIENEKEKELKAIPFSPPISPEKKAEQDSRETILTSTALQPNSDQPASVLTPFQPALETESVEVADHCAATTSSSLVPLYSSPVSQPISILPSNNISSSAISTTTSATTSATATVTTTNSRPTPQ